MRLTTDQVHYAWDNSLPPEVSVAPGDRVELDTLDASAGQLTPASVAADIGRLEFSRVNPVTGPIAVDGVRPGDALIVRIVSIDVEEWGWAAVIPGFGLLADHFTEAEIVHATTSGGVVQLPFGPRLPSVPMLGTLGVALPEPGAHPLLPPSRYGGNLDIRHLTAGATIRLPVGVPDALLSIGDAHATMADGEVCGTGVETRAHVVVELDVEAGAAPPAPILETSPATQRVGPALVTTGVGPDLMTGARDAARTMIDEVVRRTGLAPAQAYVLASLTADLVISEIVDVPNFVVSVHLPLSVLE
ncbi:MAG TPA: acetamidase/formamidase family protein [Mycobacteriales bacterium]|jgi:formamidase|nr:acetamidase/formamidase family protein [Mycobacteriales bacterium]